MIRNKVELTKEQSQWLSSLCTRDRFRTWLEDIGRYEDVIECLTQGWYCSFKDRGWLLELRELYLKDWVLVRTEDTLY